MNFLKVFSYSNIFQRRIVYYNICLTLLITGFIFSDSSISLIHYFYYYPVIKTIIMSIIIGFFTGNLFGRLLFLNASNFKKIYITSELLFIILSIVYLLRNFIPTDQSEVLILLFNYSPYYIPAVIILITFFAGIKLNYFLKISCGDFIDDKQGIIKFIAFSILGIFVGISIGGFRFISDYPQPITILSIISSVIPLLILPTLFMIKLSYNPAPIYAQQFEEEPSISIKKTHRDDLFFNYLNFSYIVLYIFLGYASIIKFYGGLFYIKIIFFIIISLAILCGFLIGKMIKVAFWHIYTEMIFPIFFLLFIFTIYKFHDKLSFYTGIALLVPALIVFGFSLYHSIINVIDKFEHNKRFNIIDFSIIILPVPIVISVSFIIFTNTWYFVLIYILTLSNILIPGIYLINKKINAFKKFIYFIFSLIFIPLLIVTHMYLDIPLNNDLYVTKTKNYEQIKNTNYNANYIKTKSSILMNSIPTFNISDSIIRNMKRSLIPIVLYHPVDDIVNKILFIDGNQRFFRNPFIAYFDNSICLDTLSDYHVDFNRLSLSGQQTYIPEDEYLMFYFQETKNNFFSIVDIPNIQDQNKNYYRFTEEYYDLMKKHLHKKGVFTQLFHISHCRPEFLSNSVHNLKKSFKKHIIYLFTDILVIMSSDDENAFNITGSNWKRLTELINRRSSLKSFFYNEYHVLSHLLFTEIDNLFPFISNHVPDTLFLFNDSQKHKTSDEFLGNYTMNNNEVLKLIPNSQNQFYFSQNIRNNIINRNMVLTLLKKTELAESEEKYEEETKYLFELKRLGEYRAVLKEYLKHILSYKEEYYYNAALRLEKEKKWEQSKNLYKAILTINPNNFDANYRLGLLCITLQDIDNSFKYLQHAMNLKRNHPKVLHQMGVLLFSSGKTAEAIDYFHQAINLKESSASIYLYLGLSYEKLGKLYDAERYYLKAQHEDPNDINIRTRLKNLKIKKEKEKNKWKQPTMKNQLEAEQGEDIPLPINKSAYDIRLKDEELKKYKDEGRNNANE